MVLPWAWMGPVIVIFQFHEMKWFSNDSHFISIVVKFVKDISHLSFCHFVFFHILTYIIIIKNLQPICLRDKLFKRQILPYDRSIVAPIWLPSLPRHFRFHFKPIKLVKEKSYPSLDLCFRLFFYVFTIKLNSVYLYFCLSATIHQLKIAVLNLFRTNNSTN